MSYAYQLAALKSASKGSARHLLLYLALRSNKHGVCYPSIDKITADTGLSQPTIYRATRQLIDLNELETWQKNRGTVVNYKLLLDPIHGESEGIQSDDKGIHIDNEGGIQFDSKGIQIDDEGIQFDKKGIQSEYQIERNVQRNKLKNNISENSTSARIDDLLKKTSEPKKGLQAGSLFVPEQGWEETYEYVNSHFPPNNLEQQFTLLQNYDRAKYPAIKDWHSAQFEHNPHATIYVAHAVNFFKQNLPAKAVKAKPRGRWE